MDCATDVQLRTLTFWQGGGIIFKNGVPKSSKLVLKYMQEAGLDMTALADGGVGLEPVARKTS